MAESRDYWLDFVKAVEMGAEMDGSMADATVLFEAVLMVF